MEEISLTGQQTLDSIRVDIADNGGAVLKYTIYTPSGKHSESTWDEKTEIYEDEEIETKLLPRITQLYRTEIARKKGEK